MKSLIIVPILVLNIFGTQNEESKIRQNVDSLEKPLNNPFVENYILH